MKKFRIFRCGIFYSNKQQPYEKAYLRSSAERPKNTAGIISVSASGTLNPSGVVSFVILFFLLIFCTRLFSFTFEI